LNFKIREARNRGQKLPLKGELRWVLLYINPKFFPRADFANHKILVLLKGHFTIYKNNPAYEWLGNSRLY